MNPAPARAHIDGGQSEPFRSLSRALGLRAFGVSQLTLAPGARMRVHRHREQQECYLVLEGRLEVVVERDPHVLEAGELLAVGPAPRRQLTNPFRQPAIVLAIGGAGDHVAADGEAFADWDATEPQRPRDVPYPEALPESELR